MPPHSPTPSDAGATLLVVATPMEAEAVLRGVGVRGESPAAWEPTRLPVRADLTLVVTGVGKSNAAGATALALARSGLTRVINLGIAGALGADGGAHGAADPIGRCIVATASVFADEGVRTPDGFTDVAAMGFAPLAGAPGVRGTLSAAVPCDDQLVDRLSRGADARGPIATVSTCSGTDALAREVAARTGALAEAMEGAAVGLVAARMGAAFAEARAISNTTGDRASQRWDVRRALDRLAAFAATLSPG